MKTKSKRLANIELLRIIAMCMVIILHYLGKGELLPKVCPGMGAVGYAAWLLESLSIVAVNVYVLISGYFLVETGFKIKKAGRLILQVLFYTILLTAVALAVGIIDRSDLGIYNLLVQLCPFQMEQYWFMTSYLVLYLLSPVLAAGVKSLSQKQLRTVVLALVGFLCVEKSILPVQIAFDKRGYDALWFICLFLIAAYIRLYGIKLLEKPWAALLLYLAGSVLAFAENMVFSVIYEKTGELGHLISSSYSYNHIFVLAAAVGLFSFFLKVKIKEGVFATLTCKIAPYTLGVYLLHEHISIRYLWPGWLGADKVAGVGSLLLYTLLAVVLVFTAGVLTDFIRSMLFDVGSKLIHGKKTGKRAKQ